jgi:hypothetical protein
MNISMFCVPNVGINRRRRVETSEFGVPVFPALGARRAWEYSGYTTFLPNVTAREGGCPLLTKSPFQTRVHVLVKF